MKIEAQTQVMLITAAQISICCLGVYMILGDSSQILKIMWGGIIAFNLIDIFKN